jgi:hypothetical protein
MKRPATVEITTSERSGNEFCDEACEHYVLHVKFPPQAICKICGPLPEQDSFGRTSRHLACKYICGEEVPERFWSPLREQFA